MTDPSTSVPPDAAGLTELVEAVLDQAEELATLDAPRAEAWAGDLIALAEECVETDDPVSALAEALVRVGDARAATALYALTAYVDDLGPIEGPPPAWAPAIATSVCEAAWLLTRGSAISVAFRFVDALDARHVVTVDLVPGPPETVGEVVVGPGDLLDALTEDDAGIEATTAEPPSAARRVARALAATDMPRPSAVVNGHLLVARLGPLTDETFVAPRPVPDDIPDPAPRDPDDDAYAVEILTRALGLDPAARPVTDDDIETVGAVVDAVAPTDLVDHTPAERDAVLALEWADWLGAVIGLVRAGPGATVDGDTLVDLVNRCPEVTSTIPKQDRPRIAWAFATLIEPWTELGLVADGRLTERGVVVLPMALRAAWTADSSQ